MRSFFILTTTLLITLSSVMAQSTTRSELSRYTLLRDRTMLERDLKREPFGQFFEFDIYASSGLKSLMGDIKAGSENSNPLGTSNVLNVLNREINSEHYIDIDIMLSSPLPYLKLKKFRLLPNVFLQQNLGTMVTLSNRESTTNPRAQLYIKTDRKIGFNTRLRWKKDEEWRVAAYLLARSDFLGVSDSASIAQSEKLFEFQDLTTTQDSYNLDLVYIKNKYKYRLLAEVQELKLYTANTTKSEYGNRALFHTQFMLKKKNPGKSIDWFPFVGLHQRKKYSLFDGMYIGSKIKTKFEVPVEMIAKISNQFFTFIPQIKFKWFEFSYSLKLAYANPQDDIWVPAIHSVNFRVPFP